MNTNQPTNQPIYSAAAPGMLGTSIPSTVAFAIGVLLFFLPFVDIKCNNVKLQDIKGYELATGFTMKNNDELSNSNDENSDGVKSSVSKADKKDPNLFAMVALGLGVIGLFLCFAKNKMAAGGGIVAGVLGAAALIGLMIDVKQQIKTSMPPDAGNKTKDGTSNLDQGFDKIGEQLSGVRISADFTPWFYIAVIAFLAGAYFCYKRWSALK